MNKYHYPTNSYGDGFTLVELLVVLVLIAIFSTVAVVSVRGLGMDRELREETLRMIALLELASDEAVMEGREIGLRVEPQTYRFLDFDYLAGQWQPLSYDRVLRERGLPDGTEVVLYLEDREVLLETGPLDAGGETPDVPPPQIVIFSSGELTPFTLNLRHESADANFSIIGHPTGRIEFKANDES